MVYIIQHHEKKAYIDQYNYIIKPQVLLWLCMVSYKLASHCRNWLIMSIMSTALAGSKTRAWRPSEIRPIKLKLKRAVGNPYVFILHGYVASSHNLNQSGGHDYQTVLLVLIVCNMHCMGLGLYQHFAKQSKFSNCILNMCAQVVMSLLTLACLV